MLRSEIEKSVREAEESRAYRGYKETLHDILAMIDSSPGHEEASPYWSEELAGLQYMFDAGPLIVAGLREHCHHLTGIRAYEYRNHHARLRAGFANKLARLRELDDSDLFVPESHALGGFGFDVDGDLVNLDTLKYYESILALGVAGELPNRNADHTVLEIGGGWGGLAYQYRTLFPGARYVIIDLPQVLLFAGTYLRATFPGAKFVAGIENVLSAEEYDFALLPHFAVEELAKMPRFDLAMNTVSFQEMTSAQVRAYVHSLASNGCPVLYSHNRRVSPNNREVGSVAEIIGERYRVEEIELLDRDYTDLSGGRSAASRGLDLLRSARRVLTGGEAPPDMSYAHHVGRLRGA